MTDWKHNFTILELMNKIIVILINKEEVDFLHISIRNPNFLCNREAQWKLKLFTLLGGWSLFYLKENKLKLGKKVLHRLQCKF